MTRLAEVYTETYSTVWRDMHFEECSNLKTNWTSQTASVTIGKKQDALHVDNTVTQLKSAWEKCTIWHTIWHTLDVQEGKLWLGLVLFQTAERLGSACSGQSPVESSSTLATLSGYQMPSDGSSAKAVFVWADRPPTRENWIRKWTWRGNCARRVRNGPCSTCRTGNGEC